MKKKRLVAEMQVIHIRKDVIIALVWAIALAVCPDTGIFLVVLIIGGMIAANLLKFQYEDKFGSTMGWILSILPITFFALVGFAFRERAILPSPEVLAKWSMGLSIGLSVMILLWVVGDLIWRFLALRFINKLNRQIESSTKGLS